MSDGPLGDGPLGDGPVGDDEYLPDPDAAPTVEGRVEQARAEMKKLMRASIYATLTMGSVFLVWDLLKGSGLPNTLGYVCGAAAATLNMWSIGGAFFGFMRESAGRALLGILGAFIGLVVLAAIVVITHKDWVLGFAIGLTTPAVAGLFYARTMSKTS